MIPGSANALMLGGDPCELYQIANSVRFNAADTSYLSHTMVAPTDGRKWTLNLNVKLPPSAVARYLLSAYRGSINTGDNIYVTTSGAIGVSGTSGGSIYYDKVTNRLFRDPSAHFNLHIEFDSTQPVAADRLKIAINGSYETSFASSTDPALNATANQNSAGDSYIGANGWSLVGPLDGYLSEIHFVDGQALDPFKFGFFCPPTGQWLPKNYAGTYGTNGFYLDFSDGSAATAGALGADRSGNGNNWTPTNISVTAGAGNDWLEDTPTNNFCTLNPLNPVSGNATVANGALDALTGTTGVLTKPSTFSMASGKWFWEVTPTSGSEWYIGIIPASYDTDGTLGTTGAGGYCYANNANKWFASVNAAYGATFTVGDVIGVAFDADAGTLTYYKNGVSQGEAFSGISGEFLAIASDSSAVSSAGLTFNFGQRAFAYSQPSGFKTLCARNLPRAGAVTVSGSFTGNAAADGPFVYMNGTPLTLTINGNAVTFGTHADALSNGFKLRTNSASYNAAGTNNWVATITSDLRNIFKHQNAKGN